MEASGQTLTFGWLGKIARSCDSQSELRGTRNPNGRRVGICLPSSSILMRRQAAAISIDRSIDSSIDRIDLEREREREREREDRLFRTLYSRIPPSSLRRIQSRIDDRRRRRHRRPKRHARRKAGRQALRHAGERGCCHKAMVHPTNT